MKNKKYIILGVCAVGLLATGAFLSWKFTQSMSAKSKVSAGDLSDQALLALIKNDEKAFAAFLDAGGNMQAALPLIDGKTYTVAEGLSYFERPNFVRMLQSRKMKFIGEKKGDFDILSLAIPKNSPELFGLYLLENPNLSSTYGEKDWSLLHLASIHCSYKLTSLLHEKGDLNWNQKAKDGSTPLTLAAEHECLPVLSYWKEKNADFKMADGKGRSALSILKHKKDAALTAFADSFETRAPAAISPIAPKPEVNFYKKRTVPKEKVIDHTALVEPEARPIEPVETADMSEFAD